MTSLTAVERELVALGAAIGSNCVPCIQHHIPEAKKAGLSGAQIREALRLADRVRQVPAAKVLAVAMELIGEGDKIPAAKSCAEVMEPESAGSKKSACCGA